MALASCGNNNIVMKREPTDSDFVFMAVLDKGEIINLQYPSGTIFRSKKGVSGFSSMKPSSLYNVTNSCSCDFYHLKIIFDHINI